MFRVSCFVIPTMAHPSIPVGIFSPGASARTKRVPLQRRYKVSLVVQHLNHLDIKRERLSLSAWNGSVLSDDDGRADLGLDRCAKRKCSKGGTTGRGKRGPGAGQARDNDKFRSTHQRGGHMRPQGHRSHLSKEKKTQKY